jgi:predicted AAA+ superfamily ATPase
MWLISYLTNFEPPPIAEEKLFEVKKEELQNLLFTKIFESLKKIYYQLEKQ